MDEKHELIEKIKFELIDRYVVLMSIILGIFTLIFTFYIHDEAIVWYLVVGLLFLDYTYILIRKRGSVNNLVHLYLIVAPLYNLYILLVFWEYSVASICWLLPITLGAYVFFTKKEVIAYTLYSLFIVLIGYILANNLNFDFPKRTQKEVVLTDAILIISNILVVTLLIYYKDKIRKQEILLQSKKENILYTEERKEKITITDISSEENEAENENMERLFSRIEETMKEKMLFKDAKFNLSALSVELEVNSAYISKAIRYKGFPNFNNYLNIYRINHVKELFTEVDFQKTTLMYIYTEAGFSNQSTFNRVFKQIEGKTPSNYFHKNMENNKKATV
ncbi:helix-turn-helix domain-containing protein [Chryseobacterium oryctis]|uniref:AraC family transcriptional regulator n=1 Tax=Chryseobacterium oryctis TaxID=2952618 RepID=A0ABT3HQS7_9FLAO|nr:AraC family transcriptional regulator [Chryseobacterium oryctis]MCW3162146.1 AraC family transcriptional regulator [Chryseobacterium oryctis]